MRVYWIILLFIISDIIYQKPETIISDKARIGSTSIPKIINAKKNWSIKIFSKNKQSQEKEEKKDTIILPREDWLTCKQHHFDVIAHTYHCCCSVVVVVVVEAKTLIKLNQIALKSILILLINSNTTSQSSTLSFRFAKFLNVNPMFTCW